MEIKVKKLSYKELEQGYKNVLNRLSKCEKKLDKIKEIVKNDIRIDDEYPAYMEMLLEDYKKLNELLEEIE